MLKIQYSNEEEQYKLVEAEKRAEGFEHLFIVAVHAIL